MDPNILNVTWSDQHTGHICSNEMWREHFVLSKNDNGLIPWNNEIITNIGGFVTIDYNELWNNDASLEYLYNEFDKYGIVKIKNGPKELDTIQTLGRHIACNVYSTMHGDSFKVERVDDAVNPAYTEEPLWVHTDLCHLKEMPDYFLFHCIINETHNTGNSVYTDGFNIANIMKHEWNYYYNLLTKYKVPFRDHQNNWDFYQERYIIELNEDNDIEYIHFNEGTRYSVNWDIDNNIKHDIYQGIKIFEGLSHDTINQYNFWMEPGEITLFNNRRILHGRQIVKGKRLMQGTYILKDHLKAKQRAIQNRLIQ